jgi:hypothetical protein
MLAQLELFPALWKSRLARLGTLEAAGICVAAQRLTDVSFAPVSSLLYAEYPNFFTIGVDGISATLRYAEPSQASHAKTSVLEVRAEA